MPLNINSCPCTSSLSIDSFVDTSSTSTNSTQNIHASGGYVTTSEKVKASEIKPLTSCLQPKLRMNAKEHTQYKELMDSMEGSKVLKNIDKTDNLPGVDFNKQISDSPKDHLSFKNTIKENAANISKLPDNSIGEISYKELQTEKDSIKYHTLDDLFKSLDSFNDEDIAAIAKHFFEEHQSRLEKEAYETIYDIDLEFPCEENEISEPYYFRQDVISEAEKLVVQNDIIPKAIERSLSSAANQWNSDSDTNVLSGESIEQKQFDLIIDHFTYEIERDVTELAYKLAANYDSD